MKCQIQWRCRRGLSVIIYLDIECKFASNLCKVDSVSKQGMSMVCRKLCWIPSANFCEKKFRTSGHKIVDIHLHYMFMPLHCKVYPPTFESFDCESNEDVISMLILCCGVAIVIGTSRSSGMVASSSDSLERSWKENKMMVSSHKRGGNICRLTELDFRTCLLTDLYLS